MLRSVVCAALFACFWASSLMVRQGAAGVPFFLHYTSHGVEIALCLLVALLAWRWGVRERLLRRCALGAVGAYVLLECARLMGAQEMAPWIEPPLGVLSGIANGASVALLVLLFARGLSSLDLRVATVIVPASLGCAHGLFLLVGLLPSGMLPWMKPILLTSAALGLARWMRPVPVENAGSGVGSIAVSGRREHPPLTRLTLWLGMVVFPLLYGFMAQICAAAQISLGLFDLSTELVDIGCMGILALGALRRYAPFDAEAAFAVILSVFATAFLFLPVFWDNEVFVAGFIMKCGFGVYTAMLWVALLRVAAGDLTRCLGVFGIALAIYHGALMVGRLVAHALTTYGVLSYRTVSFAALAVVWLLSMAALVVLAVNRRSRVAAEKAVAHRPRGYDEAFEAFAAASGLSQREQAVCHAYARGRTVDYIAHDLQVSQETIKTHLKRAYAKTDCHSRQDLLDCIDCYRECASSGPV